MAPEVTRVPTRPTADEIAAARRAFVWAEDRYAIHFDRCPARKARRHCQTCLDLEADANAKSDVYGAIVMAAEGAWMVA